MEVGGVGSLVWLQRKNGKWWPGRIVSASEVSASDRSSSPSTSEIPIVLLGRKSGSVEWHKLEHSRHIKSFRCRDFDDVIRKAESSQASPCTRSVNYVHHKDAILHALQLEKQEVQSRIKRPGQVQHGVISRAKRSRCVHLPVESFHHVLHSQPAKISPSTSAIDDCFLKSTIVENTSPEATISTFPGREIKDSEGIMQRTGSYRRHTRSMIVKEQSISNSSESYHRTVLKKQKSGKNSKILNGSVTPQGMTNGKKFVTSRNRRRNMRDLLIVNAASQEKSRCRYEFGAGEQSSLEVNKLLSCGGRLAEDSDSLSFGSASPEHPSKIETMLMDVEVTVLANHRKEDVPLLSLMSRLNGKAIIGHPIEIEALDDTSEVLLVRKGQFHCRLENDENRMNQLVWRTSMRTPVCYISSVQSSPSKADETEGTCKYSDGSSFSTRKSSPPTEKALWKPLMKPGFSKNETVELYNAVGQEDGLNGQKGCVKQSITCVPVNFIFTNLLLAVGSNLDIQLVTS